jgi:hypothetical protein
MAFLEQGQAPYTFHIRSPLYVRALGLPLIALVVCPIAFLYCKFGIRGTKALFVDNFASWFVILAMMGALAFALWILLPPQSTLARFEFTREHIRFFPNLVARFMGETSEEAEISTASAEVLLCYRVWRGQQPGYRVIVRSAEGHERELASHSPHTHVDLNPSEVDTIADAISPATGLPARVVIRRKSPNGTIEEVPWKPPASKTDTLLGIGVLAAAFPYAGGILMGWWFPSPAIVIAGGLALWLCMVLAVYFAARTGPPREKLAALRILTTLVTFSAAYGACFVVTAYLRGRL